MQPDGAHLDERIGTEPFFAAEMRRQANSPDRWRDRVNADLNQQAASLFSELWRNSFAPSISQALDYFGHLAGMMHASQILSFSILPALSYSQRKTVQQETSNLPIR
jgi:hypothetical protein